MVDSHWFSSSSSQCPPPSSSSSIGYPQRLLHSAIIIIIISQPIQRYLFYNPLVCPNSSEPFPKKTSYCISTCCHSDHLHPWSVHHIIKHSFHIAAILGFMLQQTVFWNPSCPVWLWQPFCFVRVLAATLIDYYRPYCIIRVIWSFCVSLAPSCPHGPSDLKWVYPFVHPPVLW